MQPAGDSFIHGSIDALDELFPAGNRNNGPASFIHSPAFRWLVIPMAALVFMFLDEPHNLQTHGFGSVGHNPVRRRQDFRADLLG